MKKLLFLPGFFLLNVALFAQQKDISVFEKKDINKNSTVAHDIGNTTSDMDFTSATTDSTDLIVYFKPGCNRCESFLKILDEKCIRYKSVDMSTDDPRIPQMWKDIQTEGFNGGTIRYPIIRYQGAVIWDMMDMNAFIESLPH